jgi:CBS domain-containing protein
MMPCPFGFFKDEFPDCFAQPAADYDDKAPMAAIQNLMTRDVVCADMDTPLGKAMDLCSAKRIRHLPVLDEQKRLIGLVTDRDLRYFVSPRLGTISENKFDRESLDRPLHLIMVRSVVVASADATIAEAARLMLANRVGCLPIGDSNRNVVGIITTTDLLRDIAESGR